MAASTGIGSILAKMSTSEALMDDGFVVCCRVVMISVRQEYMRSELVAW